MHSVSQRSCKPSRSMKCAKSPATASVAEVNTQAVGRDARIWRRVAPTLNGITWQVKPLAVGASSRAPSAGAASSTASSSPAIAVARSASCRMPSPASSRRSGIGQIAQGRDQRARGGIHVARGHHPR